MRGDVWILGGTGRTGQDIALRVAAAGAPVVLVGRDADRLSAAAQRVGSGVRTRVAGDAYAMAAAVTAARPAVVVNTVGPFARTAGPVARACLPATSYLDLSNDAVAASQVFGLQDEAAGAGRTLVPGAGFGVLGTEALVLALCRDQPTPERVRVDALPSLATSDGALGEALARTIVEGIPYGGRRFRGGHLVRTAAGSEPLQLRTPDGATSTTVSWPSGDLVAAQRVSGAPDVVAATSELPSGPLVRLGFAVGGVALRVRPLRELAVRRVSAVRLTAAPRPRTHSWGHAVVTWPDGRRREGWLRTGDAGEFTAAAAAAVAVRLARGEGTPGAHSPAAAFATRADELVREAGGELLLVTPAGLRPL